MRATDTPQPRAYHKRITRALKMTRPGEFHGLTKKAAAAFRAWGEQIQGWTMTQRQSETDPNIINVWRVK